MPGRLIGVAHPRLLRANAQSKLAQILVFYMRTGPGPRLMSRGCWWRRAGLTIKRPRRTEPELCRVVACCSGLLPDWI
jgi:hypothetical protein